jgi:MFS family permease
MSTGYAMFFGGLLMFGARLGDRFGHRRIIFTGLAIFTVAAVAGATAPSVVVLTGARCLHGAAAAMSVPSALRLLTTITADGPQRERAIAGWSASGAAAGAGGFVVGGVVTYLVGWRAVFWVYVAVAALLAVAVVLAGVFITVDRRSVAPLLPRAVLGMSPLRQGAAGGLLNTLTTSSAITLATLYLQNTLVHGPLVAGLMLLHRRGDLRSQEPRARN